MKYEISVLAMVNNDGLVIYEHTTDFNVIQRDGAFLDIIKEIMPTTASNWVFDDGEDKEGSKYCQYVSYPLKSNRDKYLLASFYACENN